MFKRLAAVVLALVTRRLLWAWGAAYLALMVFGFLWSKQEHLLPAYPETRPLGEYFGRAELELMVAEGRQTQVEALNCRYDWDQSATLRMLERWSKPQRAEILDNLRREHGLPDFDRFPALHALDLKNCVVFPEDAARLARCHSLEWLSLEGTQLVDTDASFLDHLEGLETLIVGPGTDAAVFENQRRLPILRTLLVGFVPPLQQQALAAFHDSPRLRSVVIKDTKLSPESVALLKSLPSLRQVFVSGYTADPQAIKDLRRQLPQVDVWHAELAEARFSASILLFMMTTCLGVGMVWLAQTTFSVPQTRLFPRYMAPNLGILLGFAGLMIALQTLVATRFGASALPVAAIEILACGLLAAVMVFNNLVLTRPGSAQSDRRFVRTLASSMRALPTVAIFVLFFLGYRIFLSHRYFIESYLLGELFAWSLVFLFSGLALLGIALAWLPQLPVALSERGFSSVLTFEEMQRRQQSTATGTLHAGWERRLARLPKAPVPPTWIWQAHAMRAAGSYTFRNSLMLLVIMATTFVGPQWLMGLSPGRRSGPPVVVVLLMLMSLQPAIVTAAWWQRRRAFPTHLLFPWSREEFTKAAFRGFGCDVLATLVAPLLLLPVANLWLHWNLSPGLVLLLALAAVSVSALVSAWMLWVLTFRQGFLAILVAYFGAMLLIFAGTIPAFASMAAPAKFGHSMPAILLAVAAISTTLATILVVFAYRRWLRVEWGLIAAK